MQKFGRVYDLKIQVSEEKFLNVKLPFTVEFDIVRNILSSASVSDIRVYNLNADHRNQVRKNINDFAKQVQVEFKAGYGDIYATAFSGTINEAWSVRNGTNWITHLQNYDAGFAFMNGQTAQSFGAETPKKDLIKGLIGDLPGVKAGVIGKGYDDTLSRSASLNGSSIDLLREQTDGNFFIDNGIANVLDVLECLEPQGLTKITPEVGLLNTPKLEQSILFFEMLFEPRIRIGQAIDLEGIGEKVLNGKYKVVSIAHHGTISDAVCREAVTEVGLFAPLKGSSLEIIKAGA